MEQFVNAFLELFGTAVINKQAANEKQTNKKTTLELIEQASSGLVLINGIDNWPQLL